MAWRAVLSLLAVLLWTGSDCQAAELINSFEVNWSQAAESSGAKVSTEFSPPPSAKSVHQWVPSTFGPCYGCGRKSYKAVTHDCVHRLPMQLTMGNYTKSMIGVFKVPDTECVSRPNVVAPAPVSVLGCGPPCSDVRLLRGKNTGCRCDHGKKLAYDVPKLVCQNNRNRTVSLALCKFLYESNPVEFQAVICDYAVVCNRVISWIAGNFTACSHDNSIHQSREIVCIAQSPTEGGVHYLMHDSMCPAALRPPKLQFCARWAAERRFICKCSTGQAARRVFCMRESNGKKRLADEAECSWHVKPDVTRPCTPQQLSECGRSS